MVKKEDFFPKCPECGSTEVRIESFIVNGLREMRVGKNGTVGLSPGPKTNVHVFCKKCGVERKNHPQASPYWEQTFKDVGRFRERYRMRNNTLFKCVEGRINIFTSFLFQNHQAGPNGVSTSEFISSSLGRLFDKIKT